MSSFSPNEIRDYPNLNKCPDCEIFFEDDSCPLCGKVCPEEMRAGNRAPVKIPKYRNDRTGGRVQFIPWYLQTWFIILMFFFMPILGFILMWAGGWKKPVKIVVTVLAILSLFAIPATGLLFELLFGGEKVPFDTDVPKSDFISSSVAIEPEELYRYPYQHRETNLTLTLVIDGIRTDLYSSYTYYTAHAEGNENVTILLHDYRQGEHGFLMRGDRVTVWGKVGNDEEDKYCFDFLYLELAR